MKVLFDCIKSNIQHCTLLWWQILFNLAIFDNLHFFKIKLKGLLLRLRLLTSFEISITPLIVLLTSCLPAIWVLNNLPISSIFALAAIFLALSVRFLKMICKQSVMKIMKMMKVFKSYRFISYWWQYDGLLHDSHHNFPQLLQQPLENGFLAGLCIHGQRTIQ